MNEENGYLYSEHLQAAAGISHTIISGLRTEEEDGANKKLACLRLFAICIDLGGSDQHN